MGPGVYPLGENCPYLSFDAGSCGSRNNFDFFWLRRGSWILKLFKIFIKI